MPTAQTLDPIIKRLRPVDVPGASLDLDFQNNYAFLNMGGYDVDAAKIIDSMIPPPDYLRATTINQAVLTLKNEGVWPKLDLLYCFAGHSEQASLLNWKNPGSYTPTKAGSPFPVWTKDRGFTGGTTGRLDTGFSPSTAPGKVYAQDSAHFGAWLHTTVGATGGSLITSAGNNFLTPQNLAASGILRVNTAASTSLSIPSTDTAAHFIAVRRDAANQWYWRNGVTGSGAHASGPIQAGNFFILNGANGLSPLAGIMSWAHAGSGLTDADMTALNYALANYNNAVGITADPALTVINGMLNPPTVARQTLIRDLVTNLNFGGTWPKIELLYIFAAHDEPSARMNWKFPGKFTATYMGTLTAADFTVDRGITGKGVGNAQLVTNFALVASTGDAIITLRTSCHFGVVSNTEKQGVDEDLALGGNMFLETKNAAAAGAYRVNTTVNVVPVVTSSIGHFFLGRRDGTTSYFSANAAPSVTTTSTDFGFTTGFMTLLSRGATNPSTRQLAAFHCGSSLTDAEIGNVNRSIFIYRQAIGAAAYETEAQTIFTGMTVQPTAARKALINQTVANLKAAGLWAKLDVLYMLAAHDSQAARVNWKAAAYPLTAFGSPVFNIDRGFQGNATSAYLQASTYNPSTAGLGYSLNSAMIGFWDQIPATTAGTLDMYMIYSRLTGSTSNMAGSINDGGPNVSTAVAPTNGHYALRRTAANEQSIWANGVKGATNATAPTNVATGLYLLASGTAFWSNARLSAAYTGPGTMTDAEMLTFHQILTNYMTAVGAYP